jgi:hypothetical protein
MIILCGLMAGQFSLHYGQETAKGWVCVTWDYLGRRRRIMDVAQLYRTKKNDTGLILLESGAQEERRNYFRVSAVRTDQSRPSCTSSTVCSHVLDHPSERLAQDPEGDVTPGSGVAGPQ